MTAWRNRIVGEAEVDPRELMANPLNWRIHPQQQRFALADLLDEVGWVDQIIVNKPTGLVVDGHLRVDLAIERGEATVPVIYVELTVEEEKKVLAAFDAITDLAVPNAENLRLLVEDIEVSGDVLRGVIDDLVQASVETPPVQIAAPEKEDFWPRIMIQVPPDLYSEFRETFESLDGQDHEKLAALLAFASAGMPEVSREE